MRVAVLGFGGYIGYPLCLKLIAEGHKVSGLDNNSKERRFAHVGEVSAIPVLPIERQISYLKRYGASMFQGDITSPSMLNTFLRAQEPEVIINLAQQPSAPYSMIDLACAKDTQENNVIGTLNLLFAMRDNAHDTSLIQIGTMGEYGTPQVDIAEGYFDLEFRGRKARALFPRSPGSLYHASKVMASVDIALLTKLWDLRATDVMQGVVYGTRSYGMKETTWCAIGEIFGTVINRFVAQGVIGMPLTIYGMGGQTRGFLSLTDSIQCLSLLVANPPAKGEYRIVNQLDEIYSIRELAELVIKAASKCGIKDLEISEFIENPRIELEEHYYKVDHFKLPELGFKPTRKIEDELISMIEDLLPHKQRILDNKASVAPKTKWRKKPSA